jgi:hypothetical protein
MQIVLKGVHRILATGSRFDKSQMRIRKRTYLVPKTHA